MSEMTLEQYRAEVVATVACSACLAEPGGLCVRLPESLAPDYPTALRDAEMFRPGYVSYVHDDRSLAHLAHHHCQSCDGHSCD